MATHPNTRGFGSAYTGSQVCVHLQALSPPPPPPPVIHALPTSQCMFTMPSPTGLNHNSAPPPPCLYLLQGCQDNTTFLGTHYIISLFVGHTVCELVMHDIYYAALATSYLNNMFTSGVHFLPPIIISTSSYNLKETYTVGMYSPGKAFVV